MFTRRLAATSLAFAVGLASTASAQTPPRLSDMVGARAGQAEGEL